MIRNDYDFGEALSDEDARLLDQLIGWRHGSQMVRDKVGKVVGCIAHPDDIKEFAKERRKNRKLRNRDRRKEQTANAK